MSTPDDVNIPDEELVVNGGPDLAEMDWDEYAGVLAEVDEIAQEAWANEQVGH